MNVLVRFERFVERLIEGPFDWLFKTRLHAADVNRALAQALETGKVSNGRGGYLVPNAYHVFLNVQDYQTIQSGSGVAAERKAIERYLRHLLAEMEGHVPDAVQVQISSQPDIPAGQIKIMAHHLDLAQIPPALAIESTTKTPPALASTRPAMTASFQPESDRPEPDRPETKQLKRPPVTTTASQWQLHLPQGVVTLGMPVVRLGRAQNNDVVLVDRTVSKYHAQLRWRRQTYYAQNLSQTRPLKVNGQVVTGSRPLQAGDHLQLGRVTIHIALVD